MYYFAAYIDSVCCPVAVRKQQRDLGFTSSTGRHAYKCALLSTSGVTKIGLLCGKRLGVRLSILLNTHAKRRAKIKTVFVISVQDVRLSSLPMYNSFLILNLLPVHHTRSSPPFFRSFANSCLELTPSFHSCPTPPPPTNHHPATWSRQVYHPWQMKALRR